jgi:hypothetical protein
VLGIVSLVFFKCWDDSSCSHYSSCCAEEFFERCEWLVGSASKLSLLLQPWEVTLSASSQQLQVVCPATTATVVSVTATATTENQTENKKQQQQHLMTSELTATEQRMECAEPSWKSYISHWAIQQDSL